MATRTEDCPKCGCVGLRPLYDATTDRLAYHCGCGHRFTKPTVDAVQRAWDYARRIRTFDTPAHPVAPRGQREGE